MLGQCFARWQRRQDTILAFSNIVRSAFQETGLSGVGMQVHTHADGTENPVTEVGQPTPETHPEVRRHGTKFVCDKQRCCMRCDT